MQMVLIGVENDVQDNGDMTTTQDVVLRLRREMIGSSGLSDITPIQSLIGRFVDVQIGEPMPAVKSSARVIK